MHEITLLSEWFIANKHSLSINKSCYTVFGASSEEKSRINLNIGNTILQKVEFSKYLGFLLILILAGNIMLISFITRNSSGDEIANVNFLYDDIVHALKIQ